MTRSAEKPGSDPFKLVFLNIAMCSVHGLRPGAWCWRRGARGTVPVLLAEAFRGCQADPLRLVAASRGGPCRCCVATGTYRLHL